VTRRPSAFGCSRSANDGAAVIAVNFVTTQPRAKSPCGAARRKALDAKLPYARRESLKLTMKFLSIYQIVMESRERACGKALTT